MPAHSERQNSPLPPKFRVSGLLSEEVGYFSEEVGVSAGAHVGFRREWAFLTFGVSGHLTPVVGGIELRRLAFRLA